MQVVQIPIKDWRRIERILSKLEGEKKAAGRAEWLTAGQFAEKTGKTKEQIKGIRIKHPELIKPKPATPRKEDDGRDIAARYLYNWTGYAAIYLT